MSFTEREFGLPNEWQNRMLDALLGKLPDNNAPATDPFGAARVSEKYNLFNSKLLGDDRPLFWNDVEASGSGTGSAYDADSSTVTLSVSQASVAITENLRYLGSAVDGTRDEIVLCVRPLSNNAVIQGGLTWIENA